MSSINMITAEAQRNATEEIMERMTPFLDGSQLYELNKIINEEFNNISFTQKKEKLHDNYESENKFLLNNFLKIKKVNGLSDRSLERYEYDIQNMFDFINKHYQDITTEDIREYLQFKQSTETCNNRTLDNYRKSLNSFFNTMSDNGYVYKNPMTRIKPIKYEKKVKKGFSAEEIELMRMNIINLRDRAIFELLISSGIRLRELVQLNITDLDFVNLKFKVLGKGNKERICFFSDVARIHIQNYLKSRQDDNPALFVHEKKYKQKGRIGRTTKRLEKTGVENLMRRIGKKTRIENVHPHRFRRTCATNALNRGMPIEQVQKMLGHESISTTLLYVSIDENQVKMNHQKYTN